MNTHNEWVLVEDDLAEFEIGGFENGQRFIYEMDTEKIYYQFADEEPVEMEEDEINVQIIEDLKKFIKLSE